MAAFLFVPSTAWFSKIIDFYKFICKIIFKLNEYQ